MGGFMAYRKAISRNFNGLLEILNFYLIALSANDDFSDYNS